MRLIEQLLGLVGVLLAGVVYWAFLVLAILANAVAGGLVALVGWPKAHVRKPKT